METINNETVTEMSLSPKRRSNDQVKVIAVTAGKGGVGKSSIAINLSIALAKRKNRVLLLDADLGLANIDIMMGLRSHENLFHVLNGKSEIKDIILTGPENIKIIPASSGVRNMTNLSAIEHAGIINSFDDMMEESDYLIIDTAAGISETVLNFTRSSQDVIVVISDEPTSLTDSYAFIKVMTQTYALPKFHILSNMVNNEQQGLKIYNKLYRVCEQFLNVHLDYLGYIPKDERVYRSIKKQKPLLLAYPSCLASIAFRRIAEDIDGWSKNRALNGNSSFFLEKLVSNES